MKKTILLLIAFVGLGVSPCTFVKAQGVGINSSGNPPDPSAILDASSTTKGTLITRMTTAQRDAIISPAIGLIIYNSDCNNFNYYNGTAWVPVNSITASVSIAVSPAGVVCSGRGLTFTATSVNGGTSPSYQWKVNGNDVGANSATYITSSLNDGDAVTCLLTSNVPCVTGSPATSNTIYMTVLTTPTITGTTPGSRNGPGTMTLGATASAGSINWYSTLTGGSSLATGPSFTTPSLCSTATYYVDATANGCTTASRSAVTATVTKVFQVDNGCSLTTGLVSYYKMENNSTDFYGSNNGTDASMSYGNGFGKVNQGANFNGSSSYISVANSSGSLNVSGAFLTISLWVYLPSSNDGPIIHKWGNGGLNMNYTFEIYQGKATFVIFNGAAALFAQSSTTIPANQWVFLTAIKNNSDLYVYENGVQKGTLGSAGNLAASSGPMNIMKRTDGATFAQGRVDEIGIWSKALSAQEISDLYNAGAGQTMQ